MQILKMSSVLILATILDKFYSKQLRMENEHTYIYNQIAILLKWFKFRIPLFKPFQIGYNLIEDLCVLFFHPWTVSNNSLSILWLGLKIRTFSKCARIGVLENALNSYFFKLWLDQYKSQFLFPHTLCLCRSLTELDI